MKPVVKIVVEADSDAYGRDIINVYIDGECLAICHLEPNHLDWVEPLVRRKSTQSHHSAELIYVR